MCYSYERANSQLSEGKTRHDFFYRKYASVNVKETLEQLFKIRRIIADSVDPSEFLHPYKSNYWTIEFRRHQLMVCRCRTFEKLSVYELWP